MTLAGGEAAVARTAQPAVLKLLKGRADGRDSGGRVVAPGPAFRRIPPKPPTWLSREAAAEWRRVAPGLTRLDLLKEEDRATLTAYCETWAMYVRATRAVNEDGLTSTVVSTRADGTETVREVTHPLIAVARNAGRELRGFAAQFGLTPATEQALARGAENNGDPGNPFA
ncbi:phage terminase small subunit P27 family [Streptomyces sp. NPDC059578]|uniref:phage terminase small subunit P27 family n=1 Tax=Streptomyces sp. NPDC059578 TaxID=3346874 RepID=UPI00368596F7